MGGGAAGGVSAGLHALLNARLENGFELLAKLTGLDEQISKMDLVLTGEGSFDKQSLFGKLPIQLATLSQKTEIPCLIFAGRAKIKKIEGFNLCKVIDCTPAESSVDDAIKNAENNLEQAIIKEISLIKKKI